MKYAWIERHKNRWPITLQCEVLNVSASGYFEHQYCSHTFQQTLVEYGMQSSMSRKGNGWDNAPTESLWGSLKVGRLYGMCLKHGARRWMR